MGRLRRVSTSQCSLRPLVFGGVARLDLIYYGAMLLIAAALVYEHRSACDLNTAGINRAFFHSNAFVSAVFVVAVAADVLTRP